jgi:hypothetical protein
MENVAGVKKKNKRKERGKRVGMKAIWIRVQASLCETAIGRRITGFTVE